MLCKSPVVMRLVMQRIESWNKHYKLPVFIQGFVQLPYPFLKVKYVLQNIKAYYRIVLSGNFLCYVYNFMFVGRINVGLSNLIVPLLEKISNRINMLSTYCF